MPSATPPAAPPAKATPKRRHDPSLRRDPRWAVPALDAWLRGLALPSDPLAPDHPSLAGQVE